MADKQINDYREVLAEITDLDDYFDQVEAELDMDGYSSWKMVDRNTAYALFRNSRDENRVISARQINDAFKHEEK